MRAWIFSDQHVEANAQSPWTPPDPPPQHDVVVIAGDICQGIRNGVRWITHQGLNVKPVIYVPGNHEYYGFDFDKERAAGRVAAAAVPNVHLLDRDALIIDGIVFLGATLWTDYQLFGASTVDAAMQGAEQTMNDHRLIRRQGRKWRASDAISEHDLSRAWLEQRLAVHGDACVVVTHTAPTLKSIAARYQPDLLTAAFASNLDRLADGAALWVHGHTHAGCEYKQGGCRVINNPRGYTALGEDAGFNPLAHLRSPLGP
jgi:predicted phosphodiesterase